MITSLDKKILVAHLLRRAGFGCTYDQIEKLSLLEYDDVVDLLINPEYGPPEDQDLLDRYLSLIHI